MSASPPTATAKTDISNRPCLLYPGQRTRAAQPAIYAKRQKRTSLYSLHGGRCPRSIRYFHLWPVRTHVKREVGAFRRGQPVVSLRFNAERPIQSQRPQIDEGCRPYADQRRTNDHVHGPQSLAMADCINGAIPKVAVRFGSLADMCSAAADVRFTPNCERESKPVKRGSD